MTHLPQVKIETDAGDIHEFACRRLSIAWDEADVAQRPDPAPEPEPTPEPEPEPAPDTEPKVGPEALPALHLIEVPSGKRVTPIADGAVLPRPGNGKWSVEGVGVGRVRFEFGSDIRVESTPPCTLFGDKGTQVLGSPIPDGEVALTVSDGAGNRRTVRFRFQPPTAR